MRSIRVALGVALTLGALSLAGCAASPDMGDLAAHLEEVDGVNAVSADVGHPGAPWNTEVVVRLFVDDPSDAEFTSVIRGAIPALADDPTTARHGATVMFIEGVPGDYDNSGQQLRGKLRPGSKVYDELGLEFGESMRLSPEDIARLAEGS